MTVSTLASPLSVDIALHPGQRAAKTRLSTAEKLNVYTRVYASVDANISANSDA